MIHGRVRNREAILEIDVSGSIQPPRRVGAIIDTGFNGYLTLPRELVTSLQLLFAGHRRGMLADGTVARLEAYLARVSWHGRQQDVLISQAAGTPLIGMSLLQGSRLMMDIFEDGTVSIHELLQLP